MHAITVSAVKAGIVIFENVLIYYDQLLLFIITDVEF